VYTGKSISLSAGYNCSRLFLERNYFIQSAQDGATHHGHRNG
jgi:hypothetical protein